MDSSFKVTVSMETLWASTPIFHEEQSGYVDSTWCMHGFLLEQESLGMANNLNLEEYVIWTRFRSVSLRSTLITLQTSWDVLSMEQRRCLGCVNLRLQWDQARAAQGLLHCLRHFTSILCLKNSLFVSCSFFSILVASCIICICLYCFCFVQTIGDPLPKSRRHFNS